MPFGSNLKLLAAVKAALLSLALAAISASGKSPAQKTPKTKPLASTGQSETVPPRLRDLAAGAAKKAGWPALRRYGESAKDPEPRALAWLALGYREYAAADYASAQADLGRAAAAPFSLADFAAY